MVANGSSLLLCRFTKFKAYKIENFDYLQFYCATIAYHVELNAESNRSVEGLQLTLKEMSIFLRF